jgi:hypothetical protein
MDEPQCNCLACRLRGNLIEIHDLITHLQNTNYERIRQVEDLIDIDKGRLEVIKAQEDEIRELRNRVESDG